MHAFHERLARTALGAAGQYGFALAGGYAVQAAGLLQRPSEDVDLFTHSYGVGLLISGARCGLARP